MNAAVRWGLLGTAHINRRLIPAMRAARRSSVVAVASREAARAEAYAREWDIPVAHAGYEALLRDRDIEAVYIPLPNALHVEWTLRALDAGKHVLCEKPLALNAEDVDRVEAVARDRQRVVMEGFMYRHEPLLGQLLNLIRDGAIGKVRRISSAFTFQLSRSPDIRLDRALGGGSLWDIGCYPVSIARLIAGDEPVAALGFAARGPSGVDESFSGLLLFPDAIVGSVHSSFRTHYRTFVEVVGEQGVLRARHPFRPSQRAAIEIERGDETETRTVQGSPALFVRQIEEFVAAVLDGRPPVVSLRESRGNAAALTALDDAARTGRVVQI